MIIVISLILHQVYLALYKNAIFKVMNLSEKIQYINWKPEYDLKLVAMNEQHKRYVDTVNLLAECINENKCSDNFLSIFHRLAYYAENQFHEEERALYQNNYPKFMEHRREHLAFIARLIAFQQQYAENGETICADMFSYLREWFEQHILMFDKDAVEYMSKGA